MKILTCTPRSFPVHDGFFRRDTGLVCRGLQAVGCESSVVIPHHPDSLVYDDVIHPDKKQIESPDWWRGLQADAVLLYAWGDPKYLNISASIRKSGSLLIQSLDTSGLFSPYANWKKWLGKSLAELKLPGSVHGRMRATARVLRDLVPALYERKRLVMLSESDLIGLVSEKACENVREYVSCLGCEHLSDILRVIPHPVASDLCYDGREKKKNVVVVGRWGAGDEAQKDPQTTLKVLKRFLDRKSEWEVSFIGAEGTRFQAETEQWAITERKRIRLFDHLPHRDLVHQYNDASIIFCASRFESFHIASAEALCCGCSVVVADHPALASMACYVTSNGGSLAKGRTEDELLEALLNEACAWDKGLRDPVASSCYWIDRIAAPSVGREVSRIVQELQRVRPPNFANEII